ncbi:MAG: hypothetical protein ABL998_11645 [Planctomycetota bacterium]
MHATRKSQQNRRGSALAAVLVILLGIVGLLYASSALTGVDVKESRQTLDELRVKQLATAGVECSLRLLQQRIDASSLDPLGAIGELFPPGETTATLFVGEPVLDGDARVGSFSVSATALEISSSEITIALDATGYLPDAPGALPAGRSVEAWYAARSVVRFSLAPSRVFDYGYFVNNWGWFYGNTILCKGNARSNGQFDCAGYSPTISGQPLYDKAHWDGTTATLTGYQDDNGDGLLNGADGGVWSGWDVVGAQNVVGVGGQASNQHDFQGAIEMPNLSDLGMYEASAAEQSGRITIGGVEVCDAVYGDEGGEKQHLYLIGTATDPIVLDGPVVVRGDVIISGVVTGQGAIYAGRNVYCPNSVTYKNGPTTKRPTTNSEADTEAWLSTNWNKDFLGLFARENIVVGDHTNSTWKYYENYWMSHALNQSMEDAGADQIPNTKAGRDGLLGTADDDLLEGDGIFTVEVYTQAHSDAGLIPAGKSVGDAIPGSGEDIDGDGVYDGTTSLTSLGFAAALNTSGWGGNMPGAGIASYSSIASLYANNLDATFYTNHSFCWLVVGSAAAQINGAVVCRNENIIYGTPSVTINYDPRLLGGRSGMAASYLPSSIQPVEELRWLRLERDPNRYLPMP